MLSIGNMTQKEIDKMMKSFQEVLLFRNEKRKKKINQIFSI
jgi:hypothetical protein